MTKMLSFLLLSVLLCGCTTLRYSDPVTTSSGAEQDLRYEAIQQACSLDVDNAELTAIEAQIQSKNSEIEELSSPNYQTQENSIIINRLKGELSSLHRNIDEVQNTAKVLQKLQKGKICVEIQGDKDRHYIYRHIIETNLQQKELTIVSEKDADYKLTAFFKKDGVDTWTFNFLWLFWSHTLNAEADAIIEVRDVKTNSIILRTVNHGVASYKESYFLGIGPFGQ